MPTIKVQPGKLIVCCGDECVEIDVPNNAGVGGGADPDPPWSAPISGGAAIVADQFITKRVVTGVVNRSRFWSEIEKLESRLQQEKMDTQVQFVIPRQSRLDLSGLQSLSERLAATIEVAFEKKKD